LELNTALLTFCTSTNLTRSDFEITLYDCMRFYSGIWFTLGSAMARAMYTDKGLRSDRPKHSQPLASPVLI